MKYYAGLDVSMKLTFLCVLNEEEKKVYENSCLLNLQDIYDSLMEANISLNKVDLETESLSRYLTKGLKALGLPAICIAIRKIAAILAIIIK